MDEQMTAKKVKSDFLASSPSLPSSSAVELPKLNNSLQGVFNSLDEQMKRIFIRVFRFVFYYVFNRYNKRGLIFTYWAVEAVRLRLSLPPSHLVALSWLYQETKQGTIYIRSEQLYNSCILPDLTLTGKQTVLFYLRQAGYITRHTRNPDEPYSQRAQHNKQPVYIFMTRKGVNLINTIEKDLYKILVNQSFEDLTGTIKKPRKTSSRAE